MNDDIILLDYYKGAYGPTVRIDVKSRPGLERLKSLFLQLASSEGITINLAEMEGITVLDIKRLILKGLPDSKALEKKLVCVSDASFEWSMSSREWQKTAGLIDGLLEYNAPGHQYLTKEGVDDALVELSFLE